MNSWVLRLVAASGIIVAQTQSAATYIQSLPPAPDQSQIMCRNTNWEKENLTNVEGSQVHKKLAPYVTKALADARAQNIGLNVSVAYRTCEYQQQLRKMNCGLGDFNIYQKPSEQCSPPTEPAGKSLHNEGLALDFYCTGYGLFEYSPCLTWLKNNAANYHLYNHELEAWHWSTTGR